MTYRGVLFDLDGTLLDTLEDLACATNAALTRLGFPGHPVEQYKLWIGDGIDNLIRSVLPPTHCDPATLSACGALIREEYGRGWFLRTRPYPGVEPLLNALAARHFPAAILSNKPHDLAGKCVARLLPTGQFAAVLGQRPEVPRKPHPAGALEIARQLGLRPDEMAYLGDTGTDMQTATAAGMYAVGALWGFRTAQELQAAGAQKLIAHPEELLAILGAQATA